MRCAVAEEVPAAQDGCGDVSYTSTVDSVWVDDQWTLNFIHVAMDACLNSATLVETLTVIDTTPPFSRLSPQTSSGLHRQPSPSQAEVADACGAATWTSSEVWVKGNVLAGRVDLHLHRHRRSRQPGEATQTLTVLDTVPPAFTMFPNRPPRSAETPLCWTPPWRKTRVLTSP